MTLARCPPGRALANKMRSTDELRMQVLRAEQQEVGKIAEWVRVDRLLVRRVRYPKKWMLTILQGRIVVFQVRNESGKSRNSAKAMSTSSSKQVMAAMLELS